MSNGLKTILVVACALVDEDNRVLLAQRPQGRSLAGLWEFPGGKVEQGETPEAALVRELREELWIEVWPKCLAPFTFASHAYDEFHLLMPLFLCRKWGGEIIPREGQEIVWARANRLDDYQCRLQMIPLRTMLRDLLAP